MRLCLLALLIASPALASSDDAWAEFRTEVQTACTALVEGGNPVVEVNPFGSETYGAAIVTVAAGTGAERFVCIYNKQTKAAELTGAFTN
jgi:hypothetical protein